MSTNVVRSYDTSVARVDMKFEAVVIPVSDVDRAKEFYTRLGWRLDADFRFDNGFRVVQFTPPGSGCSVQFGANITSARPGSAQGLYLVVLRYRGRARRSRHPRCRSQQRVPRRDAGRSVPARRHTGSRQRTSARSRHLRLLRHVSRPGREWLAAAGNHHPASRPSRRWRDKVCVGGGLGERASACGGRSRRSRKAHRRGRPELARLVRRVHDCGASRNRVAEVKDAKAVPSPSKELNHAF